MSHNSYCFTVSVTVKPPVLSQVTGGRRFGLDTAAVRSDDQHLALPGSLIRGNLRHSWTAFLDFAEQAKQHGQTIKDVLSKTDLDVWLGVESIREQVLNANQTGTAQDLSTNEPVRGLLDFDEYWCADEAINAEKSRYRISIDPTKGAVKTNALQVIDSPDMGASVTFKGNIFAALDNKQEADKLAFWLTKGLQYQPALGALKGIGFGRITDVDIQYHQKSITSVTVNSQLQASDRLSISLSFDRPFCFARPHRSNNRFVSEDFVPGGAIKGSIAQRLMTPSGAQNWPKLHKYFDKIRITHALAVQQDSTNTPIIPPLSLVSAPENTKSATEGKSDALYDVALTGEGLIYGRAPAFSTDWKYSAYKQAYELCGLANPDRDLRVRTRINAKTGTALDEALFAVEAIQPKGLQWRATVDFYRIDDAADKAQVAKELCDFLSNGLDKLGKTKARADVSITDKIPDKHIAEYDLIHQDYAIVTLQSAARLLPNPWSIKPSNDGEALKRLYEKAWQELADNTTCLRLERFFTWQTLVGGDYLWTRFRKRQPPYNPEVLTMPGSVFVFHVADESSARSTLTRWLQQGLAQLASAPGGDDWQQTPYIAQNGYGLVAVNLALHWTHRPSKESWYALD